MAIEQNREYQTVAELLDALAPYISARSLARICDINESQMLQYFLQKITQLLFGVILCTADSFFYPIVNDKVLFFTEFVNFKALVLHRLLVAAYSNVTINHNSNRLLMKHIY